MSPGFFNFIKVSVRKREALAAIRRELCIDDLQHITILAELGFTLAEFENLNLIDSHPGVLNGADVNELRQSSSSQFPNMQTSTTVSERDLCVICMDSLCNTVLLPCGHLAACEHCAQHFTICPICRSDIVEVKTVYRA